MRSYEELLKKALSELPENVVRKERFEVPRVSAFREGSRTIIRNFSQIARAVNRNEEHLYKYLVKSLGTAGFVDSGRLTLQGKFTEEEIQKEVNSYVEDYVLCRECGAPDTILVREGRILFLKCMACGAKHPVRSF
ncbi:MAG: translation initiation factor IF-2 subunit beta [Archaeoglobus sp.]|nr:MAG: translation initiation factor IF-2 subunit beta [Archaeoglobus sp.]